MKWIDIPPVWLLLAIVLAVAIAIFVGLSIWQADRNDDSGGATASDVTPTDARDAQAAAEKAVVAILAYDYRDLEGSLLELPAERAEHTEHTALPDELSRRRQQRATG